MRGWLILGVVIAAACGGSSEETIDAPPATPDATAPGPYTVCTMGVPGDCPALFSCQIRNVTGGSTTEGYCSPPCSNDPECGAGYTGPGTPTCFMPDACVLVCDSTGPAPQCPPGLACLQTGGPTQVCAAPG